MAGSNREEQRPSSRDDIQEQAWSFFDRVYCISIRGRRDRRDQARRQFAAVGLQDRVEFVLVDRHLQDREQGIFESHLQCLRQGLEAGARTILVFEDDVFFRNFDARLLARACGQLAVRSGWQALFLGCITRGSRRTAEPSLVKIRYQCLAHAYGVSRSLARQMVRERWSGIPYDTLLQRRATDCYALYPMCAFQGLAGSDNQTVAIDRLRRLFGGLPFLQRTNELYQNHKGMLITTHLAVFLLGLLAYRLWSS